MDKYGFVCRRKSDGYYLKIEVPTGWETRSTVHWENSLEYATVFYSAFIGENYIRNLEDVITAEKIKVKTNYTIEFI